MRRKVCGAADLIAHFCGSKGMGIRPMQSTTQIWGGSWRVTSTGIGNRPRGEYETTVKTYCRILAPRLGSDLMIRFGGDKLGETGRFWLVP